MLQFAALFNELSTEGAEQFAQFLNEATSDDTARVGCWFSSAAAGQVKDAAALLNQGKLDEFRMLVGISGRSGGPAADTSTPTLPQRSRPVAVAIVALVLGIGLGCVLTWWWLRNEREEGASLLEEGQPAKDAPHLSDFRVLSTQANPLRIRCAVRVHPGRGAFAENRGRLLVGVGDPGAFLLWTKEGKFEALDSGEAGLVLRQAVLDKHVENVWVATVSFGTDLELRRRSKIPVSAVVFDDEGKRSNQIVVLVDWE